MEVENFSTGYGGSRRTMLENRHISATSFGGREDHSDRNIDLNEQLIRNRPATYFLKVTGNSMRDAHIHDGDIVIVDRSIKPQSGKIVIAVVDGDMLIRRLERTMNKVRLIPETSSLSPMDVTESPDLQIWGVVTYVIKNV